MRNLLAVILFAFGVLAVLRCAVIITTRGEGRFRFELALTPVLGFACLVAGQQLLDVG